MPLWHFYQQKEAHMGNSHHDLTWSIHAVLFHPEEKNIRKKDYLFTSLDDEENCDIRQNIQIQIKHLSQGASFSECGQIASIDVKTAAKTLVDDIRNSLGPRANPAQLRYNACKDVKRLIGMDYKVIANVAHQMLKTQSQPT